MPPRWYRSAHPALCKRGSPRFEPWHRIWDPAFSSPLCQRCQGPRDLAGGAAGSNSEATTYWSPWAGQLGCVWVRPCHRQQPRERRKQRLPRIVSLPIPAGMSQAAHTQPCAAPAAPVLRLAPDFPSPSGLAADPALAAGGRWRMPPCPSLPLAGGGSGPAGTPGGKAPAGAEAAALEGRS